MGSDGESSTSWPVELVAAYLIVQALRPHSIARVEWEDALSEAILRTVQARERAAVASVEEYSKYLVRVAKNWLRRARGARREVQSALDLNQCEDPRARERDDRPRLAEQWTELVAAPIRWTATQAEFLGHVRAGGHSTLASLARAMRCSRQTVFQTANGIAETARPYFAGEKGARPPRRRQPRA